MNVATPMKVAIFGANGRTGRWLVERALELGHDVTAFTRNPDGGAMQHERLRTVRGDIRDFGAVEAAISGQDAVVSALGQTNPRPGIILSTGTRNMISAMERQR